MMTPEQIRAGRAFLDVGQKELAQAIGVTDSNISAIEKGKTKASGNTLELIQLYFESEGLTLTDNGGIEYAHRYVVTYKGESCYLDFLNHAQQTLARYNGEILFSGSDERRSPEVIIDKLRDMRSAGITMRSLIEDGNTHIMGELDEYRWLPKGLFVDGDVKVIYADRVAYLLDVDGKPRIVVIQDNTVAQEARRQFDFTWSHSQKPSHTSSTIRYEASDE